MRRPWEQEEIELVRWCYEFTPTSELAGMLERTQRSVYEMAQKLGVHKATEVIAAVAREHSSRPDHGGRRTQYQKGRTPENKGLRRPGWAPGRMRETQFRKGKRTGVAARLWMPVGATRRIDGYVYRKVSDVPNVRWGVNWKPEHVLLWERKRGPVPAGHAVVFRDGNRERILISNLELVSRAELMKRNTIHRLPEPLKEVIRLNGAIKRHITMRRKHAEKQDV